MQRLPIFQGHYQVSGSEDTVFFAVLGSCVSACLYDGVRRIGGMNHFLLPSRGEGSSDLATLFGVQAMELLINAMLTRGAERSRLRAHLYGGANMNRPGWDIGTRNAEFALGFLADEGIEVVHSDLGGLEARRVEFHPTAGRARSRRVGMTEEPMPPAPVGPPRLGGEVDLFLTRGERA